MKTCEHCGVESHEDSELPITVDWLLTTKAFDVFGYPVLLASSCYPAASFVEVFRDGRVRVGGIFVHCSTRGDLRKLCSALGIELKEGE